MKELLGIIIIACAAISTLLKSKEKGEFPSWEICTIIWVLIAFNNN